MYEGGIRVPFVMQWKAKVKAGGTYTQPVMGFDCHATALAAADIRDTDTPVRAEEADKSVRLTLDGIDLLPYLTGEKQTAPHESLCWRAGAQHAIRMGDWKLVHPAREASAQLFNLKSDLSETTDLATKEPAKLAELTAAFAAWEKGTIPAKWVRQDQRNAETGGRPKAGAPPASPRGSTRIDASFQKSDANQDGKLTREEYPQKEIFDAVDANQDGQATLEEVRAYYQQRRGRPNP
jgi:arylsulfatase A-like enzyme